MPITIEGLTETQDYLYAIENKLMAMKTLILKRFCEEIELIAKEIVPTDTGALQASIHTNLLEATLESITMAVVAGDPNVIRGAGSFQYSMKEDVRVNPNPTTEYADLVEDRVGYMENAYQWALANVDRVMDVAIKTVIARG